MARSYHNRIAEKSKAIKRRKRSATIEWRIAENDREWAQLRQPSTPAVQTPRDLRRWVGEVLLLMFVLGGIGGWQWYATQAEWQQVASELATTIQQEVAGIDPAGSAPVTAQRFDPVALALPVAVKSATPSAQVAPTIHLLDLQANQAIVTVITPTIGQAPAYRQTQFYRHTTAGWQQTAPDATLWGAPQELETASFRWRYRERDGQVVAAVAPQLEALYTTMRHNFGLTNAPEPSKLVLEVSVTQPAGYVSPWFGVAAAYVVTSPAIYQAPVDLTDAELLRQSLALPLLNTVSAQARAQYGRPSAWQPLIGGLRLWQLWELDLPLSTWRGEIVGWLYRELAGADGGQRVGLPAHYAELCTDHLRWFPAPLQIGIPLTCNKLDQQAEHFATVAGRNLVLHLTHHSAPRTGGYAESFVQGVSERGQTVALASLLEYAVATYGRERLPVLFVSLEHHPSWATLLPSVYGVSVAEFEAGWQEYLARHYGRADASVHDLDRKTP